MNVRAGFTLIELLVVIAIIGILASVALASLNSARTAAKDSRVKQEMSSVASQIEIYQTNNGSYGTNGADDDSGSCRLGTNGVLNTLFADAAVRAISASVFADMNTSFRPYCSV